MKNLFKDILFVALISAFLGACAVEIMPGDPGDPNGPQGPGGKGDLLSDEELVEPATELETFASAEQFDRYLELMAEQLPPPAIAKSFSATAESTTASEPSITNNQEAGVDEGDIVKAHGKHLVILRRGRLFSVELSDESLTPVSFANAYPEGSTLGTWYDEMLIYGDTIVVVGFSYQVSATEIGLFDIDDQGVITHRNTWFLRSNDYYSSRNYASRLVDGKLVFYMPYNLLRYRWGQPGSTYEPSVPCVHPWPLPVQIPEESDGWQNIVQKTTIYRPVQPVSMPVLHTIVTCDLNQKEFSCAAQGIVGPYSRSFYVSKDAVFLWVSGDAGFGFMPWGGPSVSTGSPDSVVYRLPLDGATPGAVKSKGSPTDQFSFKQTDDDNHLNVLVRATANGDAMWSPEVTSGDVGLVRIPLEAFTSMVKPVNVDNYVTLTTPKEGYTLQNRFVHDHVLYGTGASWWSTVSASKLFVYPYKKGGEVVEINLTHGVDRIEVMGQAAVVVGHAGKDLHFTSVELGAYPQLAGIHVEPDVVQGETRSHGFFYKQLGPNKGMLGLPVREQGQGWYQLFSGSARVLFLAVNDNKFTPMGSLDARPQDAVDDNCQVSCVDWYGNARPIFYGSRIFGLLGYELVEGVLAESFPEQIVEKSRTDMSSILLQDDDPDQPTP